MPTARHGIASAGVGERFYVIGGGLKEGLDYSTVVEWWAPSGVGGTATAGVGATPTGVEQGKISLPMLSNP